MAEAFLACLVQVGATTDESVVGVLQEHALLVAEGFLVSMVIHIFDALEELVAQGDVVAVLGELRHDAFGDGLHLVASLGAEQVAEDGGHSVEQGSRTFEGLDGVCEGGFFGILYDGFYLLVVYLHSLEDGRFEVFRLYQVEGCCPVWGIKYVQ